MTLRQTQSWPGLAESKLKTRACMAIDNRYAMQRARVTLLYTPALRAVTFRHVGLP